MSQSNRISLRAFMAVATLAFSPAAWSLGLGDATVESYLNQPLRARIDLISSESDDLASVSAKLASAADFELIGASLEDISVPIRFSVENVGGDAYLMATSALPLNNPIVRLIVEVNWSSGRMLREYTLFLDPPTVPEAAPAPLPRVDVRDSAPPTRTESAPQPRPEAQPPEQTSPRPVAARTPAAGEYGPVASGETLWGIASDWARGSDLDVNRVMIAIQRENPQAFMNDNINLLKRGAILRMPAIGEVERISPAAAYNEVLAQEQAFEGRQAPPSAASTEMPLLSSDAAAPAAQEPRPEPALPAEDLYEETVAEAAAEPEPAEAETVPEAVEPGPEAEIAEPAPVSEPEAEAGGQLELLPPSEASELDSTYGFEESEDEGDANTVTRALRENLARSEEELIAQQQENEYLEERIRELEAQLEAQDGNVADSDMANMEQRLREERQAEQQAVQEPWYAGVGAWLLGLLVLVAAIVGWRIARRRSDDEEAVETVQEIKGEAEEILRVLEDKAEEEPEDEAEAESEPETGVEDEAASEDAPAAEEEADPVDDAEPKGKAKARQFGTQQEEADFLDQESSDPEIQLDLARAYISMGDKEAARVILQEVASNGSEKQQAEAQKMLDLI